MYRYLLLNLVVMGLVALASFWLPAKTLKTKKTLKVLLALLAMTAVFDSLIVFAQLVTYDPRHILGIYVIKAPIEDFSYAIVAAVLVPLLWERGAKK